MFGIHTPVKRQMVSRSPQRDEQRAGPSSATQDSMVRRLTGEWEAGKGEGNAKSPKSPKKVVPAPRPVKVKALPQDPKPAATRRLSSEALSVSPRVEPKYASRLTEAKAMLTKAKLHLKNSKNMKTDIKVEVTQSLERLYQLVKEAEQDRKQETNEGRNNDITTMEPRKESAEDREMERERIRVGKELVEKMAEHSKQIEQNRKEMEKLKNVIEKDQENREAMTYARVAAAAPRTQSPGHAALHSVVITSKNEMETGEEVINRVRSAVRAKEEGLQIDRIRKGKDRKIILGCRTRAEIDKVREKLEKEGKHLRVEDIQNKDPLVVLRDLLSYNGDEEVLKGLRAQNKELFEGVSGEDDRIEVKYRKRTRNPLTSHVVLRVSPALWTRLTGAGVVHVDLQRIRVLDQSPLIQCSRCLHYGHGKRFCRETVDVCCHCAGPHLGSECADRQAGKPPTCTNCKVDKMDRVDHNAFSGDCPVRRRWEELARSAVQYC
ncbi:hypothetical protein ABMA28_000651 [Loxostege sticticalis]|uniref:Gag-like protein n=1 Tax=Loxostege sticticalis TaxID=481309 RepID=A0ABD0TT31_LOXSC